jgi:hypothetical protein
MGWEIHSLDVSSAFLQGNGIQRELYLQPPIEVEDEGTIWRLKRCIYGLDDAPRAWYDRVKEELLRLGGVTSKYDDAVFLWHTGDSLSGMIVLHVDDFVYCGTEKWHRSVITNIQKNFKISANHCGSFKYIGLNVAQLNGTIYVDQNQYVDSLEPIELTAERASQRDEPLTQKERQQLRSLSGQLLWATTQSRPDVAFDSCIVSNTGKHPTVHSIVAANKTVKKLKNSTLRMVFPNLGNPSQIRVVAYADASHANLPSGGSQGGTLVLLEGNGKVAPIIWMSKKLNRVTKSPFAAETMAQAEAADAGVLIAKMIEEVFKSATIQVECRTDSKSLIDHLQTSHVIQDSRLRVDIARLKEMIELNEIKLCWIPGNEQLADPLTKAGASPHRLVEVLTSGRL